MTFDPPDRREMPGPMKPKPGQGDLAEEFQRALPDPDPKQLIPEFRDDLGIVDDLQATTGDVLDDLDDLR